MRSFFTYGFRIRCILVLQLVTLTALWSPNKANGQENSFAEYTSKIDSLLQLRDTTGVTNVYAKGLNWAKEKGVSKTDFNFLDFRLKETRHLLRYSKIAVDSAILRYHSIHQDAVVGSNYLVQTKALGFLANAYRSKRELGKAFEYNQKEIETAHLSADSLLVARALITELDIAYNSLPSPMEPTLLQNLVDKAEFVIQYSRDNNISSTLAFGKLYLSKFYIKQDEFDKASDILLSISDKEPLPVTFSKYEHLCEIAKKTKNLTNYRNYTLAFKSKAYRTNRPFVALNAHNYLLDYSLLLADVDSANFYSKQLEKNLQEVDTTKYLDFLDVTYTTLATYYRGKDTNKELQYLSYSTKINKIISARQKEAFSAILKYNNELADLEKTNSNLAKSNNFFKNNLLATMSLLLLLGVVAVILFRKYRTSSNKTKEVLVEKQQMEQSVAKKFIELNNKQRVYLEDLKYVKADRNYVEYHTIEKQIVDRALLSVVFRNLPPNFIQIHRSYVINKNFIKSSSSSQVVVLPDIVLPLSRTFKNRLKDPL